MNEHPPEQQIQDYIAYLEAWEFVERVDINIKYNPYDIKFGPNTTMRVDILFTDGIEWHDTPMRSGREGDNDYTKQPALFIATSKFVFHRHIKSKYKI